MDHFAVGRMDHLYATSFHDGHSDPRFIFPSDVLILRTPCRNLNDVVIVLVEKCVNPTDLTAFLELKHSNVARYLLNITL